jgi:hypothetical protein
LLKPAFQNKRIGFLCRVSFFCCFLLPAILHFTLFAREA